jgi:polyferredoxin
MLLAYVGIFIGTLLFRDTSEFQLTREVSTKTFTVLPNGLINNQFKLRVVNKASEPRVFSVEPKELGLVSILMPVPRFEVPAGKMMTTPVFVQTKKEQLEGGKKKITLVVRDDAGFEAKQMITILGPGK